MTNIHCNSRMYKEGRNESMKKLRLALAMLLSVAILSGCGLMKNTKTPGDGEAETVLQESEIEYTSQGYVILNGPFKFNDIYFSKFLFQSLTLDKEKLSKYTMSDKDYSFETGSFSIDYNVRNNTVNKFFNLSPNSEVNLYIGMAGEESNGFGLSIKAGSLDYYESVGE